MIKSSPCMTSMQELAMHYCIYIEFFKITFLDSAFVYSELFEYRYISNSRSGASEHELDLQEQS